MFRARRVSRSRRRGAAAVEFALAAPLLMSLVMCTSQMSSLCDTNSVLLSAIREGARIAAMDRDGFLGPGVSTTSKIQTDIQHFLEAAGIPVDNLEVTIKDYENPQTDFDLDDVANDLKLFRITVTVPYSDLGLVSLVTPENTGISASLVMRNARSSLVQ